MLKNPRIKYSFLILAFLVFSLLATGMVSQVEVNAPTKSATRSELILAMNTLRVSNGLPALIEDPIVNAVAQQTADTMAVNNMSSHIGDVRGRIAAAGYGSGATVWATENFAVGNMEIDQIMQVWADPTHMLPATVPAYCHVGAGVSQAANGQYYYVLQAAYTSTNACGPYTYPESDLNTAPLVSQIIIPVSVATPDDDGKVYHEVQNGQSFWSIAIAYQITIADLEQWNNLNRDYPLHVGQILFIPTSNTEGYATPTPVGMVIVATPDAEGKIIHEVQPYQVLIKIADAYNVSVDRILALNGLNINWPLQIGQKLLIDPGRITPSPTPEPLSAIERLTPDADGNYFHTVSSGENLTYIANLYEVNLSDLMAWNGLSAESIIVSGQRLLLRITPPPTKTPTNVPATQTTSPSATVTMPTHTPTLTATLRPKLTTTTMVESPLDSSRNALIILIPVAAVLILVGWWLWRKTRPE